MIRLVLVLGMLFSLSLTAAATADEKADAIKQEQAKLRGKWKAVGVERNGQPSAMPPGAELIVTITDDKWTLELRPPSGKPEPFGSYTVQIDPTQTPKTIDLKEIDTANKGTDLCIYKLEKDKLTICSPNATRSDFSDKRPTEFKTTDGGTIKVLKRVEP